MELIFELQLWSDTFSSRSHILGFDNVHGTELVEKNWRKTIYNMYKLRNRRCGQTCAICLKAWRFVILKIHWNVCDDTMDIYENETLSKRFALNQLWFSIQIILQLWFAKYMTSNRAILVLILKLRINGRRNTQDYYGGSLERSVIMEARFNGAFASHQVWIQELINVRKRILSTVLWNKKKD